MNKFTRHTIVIIWLISILLSGCSYRGAQKLPQKTETEIWEEVYSRSGSIQDFEGLAELTIESGIKVIPIQARIFFKVPDWLTVRTFGPMGLKLVEASLQANKFQVYSPFTNEYITGSLDSVNLSTRFKIPFPQLDIRSAWMRLFSPKPPDEQSGIIKTERKYYILSYPSDNNIHEIWIDSKKMRISRENLLDKNGILKGYIAYSNYKKKSGVRFPRIIEIGDIPMGVKLTIDIDHFKINSSVPDSDLMLSVPANVTRVNLPGSNQ